MLTWQKIRTFLLDCLYPPSCLSCQRLENFLCHDCQHGIEFIWQNPSQRSLANSLGPLYFDQVCILAQLQKPLSLLIYQLKYAGAKNVAPYLAELLWQHLKFPPADYLTAIPLHPEKLRERGYNQAAAIAQHLAELSQIPYLDCLERRRYLTAQAQVSHQKKRIERMQGVFLLKPEVKTQLTNKKILLLDDVFTTGATVNMASQALRLAGPQQISILAVASKKT